MEGMPYLLLSLIISIYISVIIHLMRLIHPSIPMHRSQQEMSSQAPNFGLSAPSSAAATSSWTHTRYHLHVSDLRSEDTMRQFLMSHPDQVNEFAHSNRIMCSTQPVGDTLLYRAVSKDLSLSFISWLVDKGADVNLCARRGMSPVQAANSVAVLNFLLERGADPAWQDEDNMTALHSHCGWLKSDCVERLLQELRY
jgi:hypothetical protein